MLWSVNIVLKFVMKSPVADNALSDSMDEINEKTNIICLFSSYPKHCQFFLKVFNIIIIQWF